MNNHWITFETNDQLNNIIEIINEHNNIITLFPIIEIKEYIINKEYKMQPGSRVLILKQDTQKYIYNTDIYFADKLKYLNLYFNIFTSTDFLKRIDIDSEIIHTLSFQYP